MKKRQLGRSDIYVSELCLGSMTWGSQNTPEQSYEQLDYAVSQGINFIDTAEMYPTTPRRAETHGGTEAIIGNWLSMRKKRDDVIIATKVLGPGGFPGWHGEDITPEKIKRACDESLKRLQTDYIDLYQLHWGNRGSYHFRQQWNYDPSKCDKQKARDDIYASVDAVNDLQREGKIRTFGLSNETAWAALYYVRAAEETGGPRIVSMQNEYSLLQRIYDTDLAEIAHLESVGCLAWSPLAAGLLTGKYADGKRPKGSRGAMQDTLNGRINPISELATKRYLEVAEKNGLNLAQMALAFCLTRKFITSVIIGATTMEQLKTNIQSHQITLSEGVLAEIADIYRQFPVPM